MSRTWTATKKPMSRDRLIGCDALFSVFSGKGLGCRIAGQLDDVVRAVRKQAVVVLPFFALSGFVEVGSATACEMPDARKTDIPALCVGVNLNLKHWAARPASGDSIGAGCGGFGFCLSGASLSSKSGGGGGDFGSGGHGIVWLVGASLPADDGKIPNRLGLSRNIFNYFSTPPLGLPENAYSPDTRQGNS